MRQPGSESRSEEADAPPDLQDYIAAGERAAQALPNRGPIRFDAGGGLDPAILEAYRRYGFYVLQGVLDDEELDSLRTDLDELLQHAPVGPDDSRDSAGRPAVGLGFTRRTFHFASPLSDPYGATGRNEGRHPVQMTQPAPPPGAPQQVIHTIGGPLQVMDACLRLYGHAQLLAIAEQINGPDFTPFTETVLIKRAGLGPSVAWHQDGTTHWADPEWDEDAHGFNFMAQLYGSTAANGVWVVPGSHAVGQVDIAAAVGPGNEPECLSGAVPMVCDAGDVVLSNRQLLHGSFANTSPDERATFIFGFLPRRSVLGVRRQIGDAEVVYDEQRINERARVIALAIDARHQHYPDEPCYSYKPLAAASAEHRWNKTARESILNDYNVKDLVI